MTNAQRDALLEMLQRSLGPEFAIELVQLDAIPWPTSAKRQEFVGLEP
jgi:hypothetical protein